MCNSTKPVLCAGQRALSVFTAHEMPKQRTLLRFDNGVEAIVMNLEEDNVAPFIRSSVGVKVRLSKRANGSLIFVGKECWRVINTIGEPIDGLGK